MIARQEQVFGRHPSGHEDPFTRDAMNRLRPWPTLLRPPGPGPVRARVNAAASLLAHAVDSGLGHRRCLVTDHETWTYAELHRRSHQIASVLSDDLGLPTGGRVLLRGPNAPWYAACWLGTLLAGGVVVSGHEQMSGDELADVVEAAGVTHALGPVEHLDALTAVAPHLAASAYPDGSAPAHGEADLPARCARRPPAAHVADTAADDVALIIFTSGTTGRPKAVVHFHRDIVSVATAMGAYVTGLATGDLVATTASLSFVAALSVALQGVLATGAAALMQPAGSPEEFFAAAGRHRATVVMASPGYYRWALRSAPRSAAHTPRRYLVGGEPLPRGTEEEWFARTGLRLTNIFGSTELFSAFAATRAGGRHRPGAVGHAVPGYRLRVIGPDGQAVPPGEPGRLAVTGPTGVRYLDDPARQAAALEDGWTLTGDLCSLGPDGVLWHHGRQDDLVIIEGMNVNPTETEVALLRHPAVRQAAVVGGTADDGGTELHAHLVIDGPDTGLLLAEIRSAVERRLAPFKVPRRYFVRDSLPVTHTGKVQRSRLRP